MSSPERDNVAVLSSELPSLIKNPKGSVLRNSSLVTQLARLEIWQLDRELEVLHPEV